MDPAKAALIRRALHRFRALADSLECACDPDYGYECTVHQDRQLARMALEAFEAEGDDA